MRKRAIQKETLGRIMAVMLLAVVVVLGATDWAMALSILNGPGIEPAVVEELQQAPDLSGRIIDLATNGKGFDVVINKGVTVTVERYGEVLYDTSEGETVSAFLTRVGAVPGPLDMVGIYVGDSAVSLTVDSEIVCYETVTKSVPYSSTRTSSADYPQGTEQIVQIGRAGSRTMVYEQVWSGGKMISRQLTEDINRSPVPEVVACGTAVTSVASGDKVVDVTTNDDGSGFLTFASGATMKFSAVKSMTATAYTAGVGVVTNTTATGTRVHVGTIAVDRKVIPLGTKMYVMAKGYEYGYGKAEDVGVIGQKVDLYMNTYNQCIQFGRRSADVYILDLE